jgi:hypothetical protein
MTEESLRPAYMRPTAPATDTAPETDDADLERGRTLAVIAAIGRLQMSVDVLARQQKKHQEAVDDRLARIERALTDRS